MSSLPAFSLADLVRAGGHPQPIYFPAINGSGASYVMLLGRYHRERLISDLWCYGQLLETSQTSVHLAS